jgi:hypothetical protein
LLSRSKTRWLPLFPGIETYFLSQEKSPTVIKGFFKYEFSKIYLCQMHSLMSAFQLHIQRTERESNSVVEVLNSLNSVKNTLNDRMTQRFLPLKATELLAKKSEEGLC